MEKWENELWNYKSENELEYQYKSYYMRCDTVRERLEVALKGAFICQTTLIAHGTLGNIFSFLAYNLKELL